MDQIAFLDLETTGLLKPEAMDPMYQPYIIEVCVKRGEEIFNTFVRPPVPISEEVQKITSITDQMVKDAPSFTKVYPSLARFLLGTDMLVAHNLAFDKGVIKQELARIGKEFNFPWPMRDYCTVEQTMKRLGHRATLGDLYRQITGSYLEGAHRALADVRALEVIYNWLMEQQNE